MICRKQQENWKARKRKKIKQILPYGKMRHQNISCAGKVPGASVSPAGISSAPQWPPNTWVRSLIYTVVEWICFFRITKVKLPKVRSAIMWHRFDTGYTII